MSGDIGSYYCVLCGFQYQPCVHLCSAPPWYGSVEAQNCIQTLEKDLAAERERANYAWKNTRLIDADRQRVTEERNTIRAELAAMTAERDRLREALVDACERMERARGILRKPGESGWAMLDTAALRAALNGTES